MDLKKIRFIAGDIRVYGSFGGVRQMKFDLYRCWVVDWICSRDPWEAYEIWEKALLEAEPQIAEDPDKFFSLIDVYYEQSRELLQSFPVRIHFFLWDCSWPWRFVRRIPSFFRSWHV